MKTILKMPTIGNLLDSMPSTGLESTTDKLRAYAALGYHWDGCDRRNLSVRKLRQFITQLDAWATEQLPGLVVRDLDDDDNDLFGVAVSWDGGGVDPLFFRSPTLNDSVEASSDQGAWIKTIINKLGDPKMLELPYPTIDLVVKQGLKAAGFLP